MKLNESHCSILPKKPASDSSIFCFFLLCYIFKYKLSLTRSYKGIQMISLTDEADREEDMNGYYQQN